MIEFLSSSPELVGVASLIAALTMLVHAVRVALPVASDAIKKVAEAVSNALKERATSMHIDAETRAAAEAARTGLEADNRARLDRCEQEHHARDERDRVREIEHAREMGLVRGQLAALHDEFTTFRAHALSGHSRKDTP